MEQMRHPTVSSKCTSEARVDSFRVVAAVTSAEEDVRAMVAAWTREVRRFDVVNQDLQAVVASLRRQLRVLEPLATDSR